MHLNRSWDVQKGNSDGFDRLVNDSFRMQNATVWVVPLVCCAHASPTLVSHAKRHYVWVVALVRLIFCCAHENLFADTMYIL
jgi:hypothetical protein